MLWTLFLSSQCLWYSFFICRSIHSAYSVDSFIKSSLNACGNIFSVSQSFLSFRSVVFTSFVRHLRFLWTESVLLSCRFSFSFYFSISFFLCSIFVLHWNWRNHDFNGPTIIHSSVLISSVFFFFFSSLLLFDRCIFDFRSRRCSILCTSIYLMSIKFESETY